MCCTVHKNLFQMKNVLLGCTGSVASIKIPEILEKLKENPEISVKLGKFIHTDILIFHSVEFKINLLAQLQLLHKILFLYIRFILH